MILRVLAAALFLSGTLACSDQNLAAVPEATPVEPMEPFKCELRAESGDEAYVATIYFYGQTAVEYILSDPPIVTAVYDLQLSTFSDFSPPRTVTLLDCQRWAAMGKKRTLKSLAESDDEFVNRLAELMLEPNFEVTASDEALILRNELIEYRHSKRQTLCDVQQKRIFAYDRLNAYRKAMIFRKMPASLQLAVDAQLAKHDFVPGRIDLTIKIRDGEMTVQIENQILPLGPAEQKQIQAAASKAMANIPN